ncbi:MAG: glutathione S-transferase family protein [Pseudomonadota bacterium]
MLTVYGAFRSRATRAIWLLNEMGVPFGHRVVWQAYRISDPRAPGAPLNTLSPEFLRLSPAGAIPVIEDDGFTLSESVAINFYICDRFGGSLAPKDARERGKMLQWSLYGATSVEAAALSIQQARSDGRAGTPEGQAAIDAAKDKLRRPFGVIDAELARDGWIACGRFTVADINLAEMVRYAQGEPAFLAGFPALDGWLARCQARPAFQDMWAKRNAEPTTP